MFNVACMSLGKNIQNARILRGYEPQQFANMVPMDLMTLQQLEKRDSKSSGLLVDIAAALQLSADQLLQGDIAIKSGGAAPSASPVSTFGNEDYPEIRRVNFKFTAGVTGFAVEYLNEVSAPIVFQRIWYQQKGYKPGRLFAVRVSGKSMEPGLNEGDTVVVNTMSDQPVDGNVFAVNYEGELVIKRLVRDEGEWWLSSDSADQKRYARKRCGEQTFIIGEIVLKQSSNI